MTITFIFIGPLTLVTVNADEIRTTRRDRDRVQSSYYECLGHISTPGATDLYWSIYDLDSKLQTDLHEDFEDNQFLATVRDNFLTLNILGEFYGRVSCKSRTENELQISVTGFTTRKHI